MFSCGNEQVVLWGPPKAEDVKDMALRLKFVTAQVIDRVDAEFGHLSAFRCFDVVEVSKAFGCSEPVKARRMQQSLLRHIRHFANLLQVNERQAGYEYQSIGFHIAQSTRSGRPLATKSNSEVWQAMLEPNVCVSHLPQTSNMVFLLVLISFYLSVEDGECVVERDLGEVTECHHAHNISGTEFGGTAELADDAMLAKCCNATVTYIRVGGPGLGSCARLGPIGKRWAAVWRSILGARLGCYKEGLKRRNRVGTYATRKAGVLAAAEHVVTTRGSQASADDLVTASGVHQSFFRSALGDRKEAYVNNKTNNFDKGTCRNKLQVASNAFLARARAAKWEPQRAARLAKRLAGGQSCVLPGQRR